MAYFLLKLTISAGLVVAVSELSKRSTSFGALLASLPLVSLLALIWMHLEGQDNALLADLSGSIFWLVLPSLALFLALPALLRAGWGFWPSLGAASCLTVVLYLLELWLLPRFGVKI